MDTILFIFRCLWVASLIISSASLFLIWKSASSIIRAPVTKKYFNDYYKKQTRTAGGMVRYYLSYTLLATYVGAVIFIANYYKEEPFLKLILGYSFILHPLIIGLSYLYDFYLKKAKAKLLSIPYLNAIIMSLALPVSIMMLADYTLVFSLRNNVNFVVYRSFWTDQLDFRPASPGEYQFSKDLEYGNQYAIPLRDSYVNIGAEDSICNEHLRVFGMPMATRPLLSKEFDFYYSHGMIKISDIEALTQLLLIDKFFQSLTLYAAEDYGCSFTDAKIESKNLTALTIFLIYKWFIGAFVVGIIYFPIKRYLTFRDEAKRGVS